MHSCASPTQVPATIKQQHDSAGERCTDVKRFLTILHPDGVYEVRSPQCPQRRGGDYRSTASGYFSDHAAAAAAIRRLEQLEPPAVYVTLNPVQPALLARANNRIEVKPRSTTSDAEIMRRRWLFVDIDPVRPAGVSSTDAELSAAMAVADAILTDRLESGWPEPLRGMSGNGAYLLWRIDLANDDAATVLIRGVLQSLAEQFSTATAEVDTSTINSSRICKVLGTVARKGDALIGTPEAEDRPHRRSWFIEPAGEFGIVTDAMLREIVGDDADSAMSDSRPQRSDGERTTNAREYDADDVSLAAECLRSMSHELADNRKTWVDIGIAAKSVSESLFGDWDAFSRSSPKYDPSDTKKKWDGFSPSGKIGIGTLIHHAKESGLEFTGRGDDGLLSDMAAQEELIAAEGYAVEAGMPPPSHPATDAPADAGSPPTAADPKLMNCELILVDSDPVAFRFRCLSVSDKYCELADWAPSLQVIKREFLKQTHRPLPLSVCRRWKTLPDRLAQPDVLQVHKPDPSEDPNCVIASHIHRLCSTFAPYEFPSASDVDWRSVATTHCFLIYGVRYVQSDQLLTRMTDECRIPELTRKRLTRVLRMSGAEPAIERLGRDGGAARRRLWKFTDAMIKRLEQIANGDWTTP